MKKMDKPNYKWDHPLLAKNVLNKRKAIEHQRLAELESEVIQIEIIKTRSDLHIPEVYHVHYFINTIIGIDPETKSPEIGNHHVVEITLPNNYPVEPAKMFVKKEVTGTKVWHPNIKWSGAFEGRICGNIRDFGKGYDLYQLVLRIGDILQYKNYHAHHTPPYPEDAEVANWVLEYAEIQQIVNKDKNIVIDNTPLVKDQPVDDRYTVWEGKRAEISSPASQEGTEEIPVLPEGFFGNDWTPPEIPEAPETESESAPKQPETPKEETPKEEIPQTVRLKILGRTTAPPPRDTTIKIKKKEDQ